MMKKFIYYFNNLSIRKKLLILFLMVSMIPSLVMGFSSFNISSKLVEDRKVNETIYKLKNINEKVSSLLKEKELVAIRFSMEKFP
jgi:CHASE3 domain sensor protein